MYALSLIGYVMIGLLLMSMMARARPRIKEPAPGKPLKNIPMGLASRFLLQRSSFLALATGLVFGLLTGWINLSTAGIVTAIALTTILLPMRYTFTTKGISVGDGAFYPWKGFSGFAATEARLKLNHPSLFGRLTLFVKPAEMGNVLEYVERYIRTR